MGEKGVFVLPKRVTMQDVPGIWTKLQAFLPNELTSLDWRAVEHVDSAALSLVLSVRRTVGQRASVTHVHLPRPLIDLAALYNLGFLFA